MRPTIHTDAYEDSVVRDVPLIFLARWAVLRTMDGKIDVLSTHWTKRGATNRRDFYEVVKRAVGGRWSLDIVRVCLRDTGEGAVMTVMRHWSEQ